LGLLKKIKNSGCFFKHAFTLGQTTRKNRVPQLPPMSLKNTKGRDGHLIPICEGDQPGSA
jgi:hypothetical protein